MRRGKSLWGRALVLHAAGLSALELLGRNPDQVIMDELGGAPLLDSQVIVIDSMSMLDDELAQRIRIFPRHVIDIPKCHVAVRPEKQYGKKYRRLLRSGKR